MEAVFLVSEVVAWRVSLLSYTEFVEAQVVGVGLTHGWVGVREIVDTTIYYRRTREEVSLVVASPHPVCSVPLLYPILLL